MLSDHQLRLIRSSAQVMADSDVSATDLFYASLFRKAPGVRSLFPADMFSQSEKLWASIVAVVEGIENLEALRPTLMDMGKRHAGYGAELAHYDAVKETMIETIATFLRDDWSTAHDDAWRTALKFVCEAMCDGANDAP
jgi:hemoglobin-like flavoprotein